MRAVPLLLLMVSLAAGCEPLDDTGSFDRPVDSGDTDPNVRDGCPVGHAVPTDIRLNIRDMTFNQILTLGRLGRAPHEGQPPACVSPDGLSVMVLIEVGGDPFAWLTSRTDAPGNEELIRSDGLVLDAFGYDPPTTFGEGDWYQGSASVLTEDLTAVHTLNGLAESDTVQASLFVQIDVTP